MRQGGDRLRGRAKEQRIGIKPRADFPEPEQHEDREQPRPARRQPRTAIHWKPRLPRASAKETTPLMTNAISTAKTMLANICADSMFSASDTMRWPRPASEEMVSPPRIARKAMMQPSRKPVSTTGNAAGSITDQNSCRSLAPIDCAARI